MFCETKDTKIDRDRDCKEVCYKKTKEVECPIPPMICMKIKTRTVSTQTPPLPDENCHLYTRALDIDISCEDCHQEQLELRCRLNTMIYTFVFLAIEVVLGIICFILEMVWEVFQLYVRHYAECLGRGGAARKFLVILRLSYTTLTAFPFIIIPIIVLSFVLTRRVTTYIVMIMLVCVVGFILYLIVGIAILGHNYAPWVPPVAVYLLGAFTIITAFAYLFHLIYELLRIRRHNHGCEL